MAFGAATRIDSEKLQHIAVCFAGEAPLEDIRAFEQGCFVLTLRRFAPHAALHADFASNGPSVQPLARGREGHLGRFR